MSLTPKKKVEKQPPGRPKHEIWTLGFRRVLKRCEKTHRSIHAAYCIICNKVLCNTAAKRLTAHRRVCTVEQTAEDTSEIFDKSDSAVKVETGTKIITTPENTTTITFVDMDDGNQFVTEQSTSDGVVKAEYTFIDEPPDNFEFKIQPAPASGSNIDVPLTKFFIGCNIPFHVVESSHFKKFCSSMNPFCKLPTSEQLSGSLLDTVYSKFYKDIKISPLSVLILDGWKNETNTKNVAVMIRTEAGESIFLDNYELSGTKEVNQELTEIIRMSIAEAYEQFKTEIYAVIKGNSCCLTKMESVTDVWQFSCNLHVVKVLVRDYVPQDFTNSICKILTQLNVMFKDETLESKINSENRWANTKWIFEYCIANLATIQTILSENLVKLAKEHKSLFFDEEFLQNIQNYIHFLDSANELIQVSQMPKSNIADTTEQWLSFLLPDDDSEVMTKVLSRRESVLKTQCLVANSLHPLYRGRKLSDEQMNKVEEFLLSELDADGLNSLQLYYNGDGIFRVLNQKEGLSGQTYWSLARRTHNSLANLALKLLSIPASITSNFSQFFNSIKHKSLKPDKMRKLFAVYHHLKEKEDKMELE